MAMISTGLHHPACLAPALSKRQCHINVLPVLNKRFRSVAAGFADTACGVSNLQGSQHRSRGRCQAKQQDAAGYTPASYITFSEDPTRQCHHHAEVVVDAPTDVCYSMWSDWPKLIEFLDLIGQIGLDNNSPDMALFQCFYRWRKTPIMEIVFLLERVHVEAAKCIAFKSVYGMPLAGTVDLQEQEDGRTKVKLYFTHPVPNLLVQMQVGPFGMETHMMQILKENLATYKSKVEALAPPDWQQVKQQVAARVQQQQQGQTQQHKAEAQQQQQQPQQQPQQQQESSPQAAGKQQQQVDLQQQVEPAGGKQRTSRRTAVAAASKPRSRSATSRRTASLAAAEATASSSSSTARRRSRTATAGAAAAADANNGAGPQAKPKRSTTNRRTAAARD